MTSECDCGKPIIDVAIVGAGPAGLSAGLYGSRSGLHTVVFGDPYGSQLARAGTVENFVTQTGAPKGIEIVEKMIGHLSEFKGELVEKKIKQITRDNHQGHNVFSLITDEGNSFCSHTIILTTGTQHKKLGIVGEDTYYSKGVGYCTICDGPLYKDQVVAITGFGDEAVLAAMRMSSIASKVYLIASKPRIGASPELLSELENISKIKIFENSHPLEILGNESGVTGFLFKSGDMEVNVDVSAVFIEVGVLPSSSIADGVGVDLNKQFIKVNSEQETNIEGFFAAGDITGGKSRQAIISSGDGARAAINAIDYIKKLGLSEKRLKTTQWGASKTETTDKRKVISTESSNPLIEYVNADDGFKAGYNRYNPDEELIDQLKQNHPKGKIITVSAHWCPDCRRNVPKMAKISEGLGSGWEIIVEDRDAENVREKYNVRKIPTFIIYDASNNEIGRIIENPKYNSLEEDLIKILNSNY